MTGDRAVPFHGILPRGAVEPAQSARVDWTAIGAALELAARRSVTRAAARSPRELAEGALSSLARSGAGNGVSVDELAEWIALAQRVRLVTHAEGARVVGRALRRWGLPVDPAASVCVKEGHTASVWRVPATAESPELALMVPRDEVAAAELESTTDVLVRLGPLRPGRVVETWRLDTVGAVTLGGLAFLPVVATRWLTGSRELHLFAGGSAGSAALLPVDAFAFGGGGEGTLTASAPPEADPGRLWRDLVAARVELTDLARQRSVAPEFEVNDGDFVETEGHVAAVACSGERVRERADALFDIALTSGVDDSGGSPGGGRLRPDPVQTVEALARALRRVAGDGAAALLAEAAAPPLVRRLGDFGPRDGRAAVERCHRALRACALLES